MDKSNNGLALSLYKIADCVRTAFRPCAIGDPRGQVFVRAKPKLGNGGDAIQVAAYTLSGSSILVAALGAPRLFARRALFRGERRLFLTFAIHDQNLADVLHRGGAAAVAYLAQQG
jgi:hypothetical protein